MTKTKAIEARVKCFGVLTTYRVSIGPDGTVKVYDSVAGHYTRCHDLSVRQQSKLREIAQKEVR